MKTKQLPKSFTSTNIISIGKYEFQRIEDAEWNNNKYSRAWHRQYGGVLEVSNRRIVISRLDRRAKNGKLHIATIKFGAWRGNILLAAIKTSEAFAAPKSSIPMSIRLDKFYDAKKIGNKMGVEIFERTLLGAVADYCAVTGGHTYHAESPRAAVRGLHKKMQAAAKKHNEPITWALGKKLGFCEAGMVAFCEAFGLDTSGSLSPVTLEGIIKSDLSKARRFENELRTLAKSLGYESSI